MNAKLEFEVDVEGPADMMDSDGGEDSWYDAKGGSISRRPRRHPSHSPYLELEATTRVLVCILCFTPVGRQLRRDVSLTL